MRNWYCVVNGQQYGPVSEDQLKLWIAEKRVTSDNLVWTQGMPQWVPAHTIPELFTGYTSPPSISMAGVAPPPGTGGATPNRELMAQARNLLRGQWGLAIGFTVLLCLLQMGAGCLPLVGPIASLVLTGPFTLSGIIFFLALTRRGKPRLDMLFSGFNNFVNALGAYILVQIFVILWMLLFIIPGIIAAYRYALTFYLLADDPNLGPLEAIRKSKALMKGHKGRLFCLGLRFIGWAILCIFTCGIGFLWLGPYMAASLARFYDDLTAPKAQPQTAQTPTEPQPPLAGPQFEPQA